MTFRAFIGIIVAVAVGVYLGLKFHDNPTSFYDLLSTIRTLFRFLLMLGIGLGIVGGLIYGIWWLFKYGDTTPIDAPDRLGGVFMLVFFAIFFIGCWIAHVNHHGGFKKRSAKKAFLGCLKYTGIILGGIVLLAGLSILLMYLAYKN